jgi:hypothetical protein
MTCTLGSPSRTIHVHVALFLDDVERLRDGQHGAD